MAQPTIRLMCPNLRCRLILAVPAEARGRTVRCRNCGTTIRIPQQKEAVPAPEEHAEEQTESVKD